MTRSVRTGLVLLGVVSVLDVLGVLLSDGDHPPMFIAVVGACLGLASLGCIAAAWRGRREALLPLVVLRLVSALTAIPAFFVDDVPTGIVVLAAAFVAVSLAGVALVSGSRSREVVPA
jgi:hypothetical protein